MNNLINVSAMKMASLVTKQYIHFVNPSMIITIRLFLAFIGRSLVIKSMIIYYSLEG
jgi:hypothetical protein